MAAVRVVFNKHEVIQFTKTKKTTIEHLFMSYIQAAQTVSGVLAVGIGFNLLFPADLRNVSLQDVGVAILFTRGAEPKSWIRQELAPEMSRNAQTHAGDD